MQVSESSTDGMACRCCLHDASGGHSIFSIVKKISVSYAEMIRECCSLVVTQKDGMLSMICLKCSHKLKSSYKFRRMCLEINTLLMEKVDQPNLNDDDKMIIQHENNKINLETDEVDVKYEFGMLQKNEDISDTKEEIQDDSIFDDTNCKIEYETIEQIYNVTNSDYNLEDTERTAERLFVDSVEKSESTNKINNNTGKIETALFNAFIEKKFKPDNKYCNQCGSTFSNKNSLYKHRHSVHREKILMCYHCSKMFRRKDHLERHIKTHMKDENPFHCSICTEKFRTEAALTCHYKSCRPVNDVKLTPKKQRNTSSVCELCGKYCRTALKLKEHINYVHRGVKYFCELCRKFYTSESMHISRNHGNGRQCHLCGVFYTSKSEWISHMNSKHPIKRSLKCAECEKIFTSYVTLSRHRSSVHAGITWICQYCSKIFKRKDKLDEHLKVHSDEKPYVCDVCQKAFHTRFLLTKHKLRHIPEKNFICDHCNARFRTKECVRQHQTRHDPKAMKRYACAFCKKTFRRSDHRNTHQKNVHKLESCSMIQSEDVFCDS